MPIKRIQFPDGSIKRVEVPEGATDEQILSFVQSQHSPEQQKPDFSNVTASSKSSDKGYARRSNYNPTGIDALNPVTRQVGGFADAVQHHVLNIPVALGQGVTHGLNFATQKIAPGSEAAKRSQAHTNQQDAEVRDREAAYQARTADTAGSYVGAAVGEIAPWLVGIGELRAAGLLPQVAKGSGVRGKLVELAQKGGLLAGEGAAMGALQPVTGEGSYGAQKAVQVGAGATLAPLTAGTIGGSGKLIGGIRNHYSPDARIAKLFGSDAATVAALQNADSGVQGVSLTAAQAIKTPEAVAAERTLRNASPALTRADNANNAAMKAEAERIAGTPADMVAARAARAAATDPYYASLPGQRIDASAVTTALDNLESGGLSTNPKVKAAITSLRAELKSRTGEDGKIDADVLSGLHSNTGSHLGPMATNQEKKALGPIKDAIVDALDAGVPGYRANNAAFANLSAPIKDMEAGRLLLDAINRGGLDASGNKVASLSKLESVLAKDAKSRFRMTPAARKRIEAMLNAQEQRSISNNNVAASGPGTAADSGRMLAGKLGTLLTGGGATLAGSVAGGGAGGLVGLLGTAGLIGAEHGVTQATARRAASAKLAAEAIERYNRRSLPRGRLGGMLLPYYAVPATQVAP